MFFSEGDGAMRMKTTKRMMRLLMLFIVSLGAGLLEVGTAVPAFAQVQSAQTVSVATLQVPQKAREHLERARQAVREGREDDYEREIAKALELDRTFAEAYLLRGAEEAKRRSYQAALTDSCLAERLDRGLVWARLLQASALNSLRQCDKAWDTLDKLEHSTAGQMWEMKFERARAAVGRGDAEGALRWSAETLAIVPLESLDSALVLRGDALNMAGRSKEAVNAWRDYLASPRKQVYREQVLAAIVRTEQMRQGQEIAGLGR
jgi:tetratricopeptide (TPR) repeat protein